MTLSRLHESICLKLDIYGTRVEITQAAVNRIAIIVLIDASMAEQGFIWLGDVRHILKK